VPERSLDWRNNGSTRSNQQKLGYVQAEGLLLC
jgi:hypothetical protein